MGKMRSREASDSSLTDFLVRQINMKVVSKDLTYNQKLRSCDLVSDSLVYDLGK